MLACLQKSLELSDAQLQDILHVQRHFVVKTTLLELERKALVEPLIKTERVSFPHDSFAALEADSNRLKDNLLEVQKANFTAGTVVFAGVRCGHTTFHDHMHDKESLRSAVHKHVCKQLQHSQ